MNDPDACPHPILTKTVKQPVPRFWTNNYPPTVCTSAMVLSTGSKTIHKGTNTIWQSAQAFWRATIIKVRYFRHSNTKDKTWIDHYKPQSKRHSTEGKHHTLPVKRSSYAATSRKKWCWHFYRTQKHQSWNTIYRRVQQSTMSITKRGSGTGWDQQV